MTALISSIKPHSIAQELDIMPCDQIISIDGVCPQDLMDYQYLISSEKITLHIRRSDNEEEIIDIEKDENEDLGIIFESAVFDGIIHCCNKCIFCFVDQQPRKLRKSMYIKDDDYRLSYLQGTYITLTNLNKKHRDRIEKLRPGPLYISVHSTNPILREKMLNNTRAKSILHEIKWLSDLDIPMHIQIVLCPGINDGKELERTLNELAFFKANILSIAVVPVGLTKYRKESDIIKVNRLKAKEVLLLVDNFNKKLGYNLAFPSDEFYILAGLDFPDNFFYGNYSQLDDGVGSCRILLDDFEKNRHTLPKTLPKKRNIFIATGSLAFPTLNIITDELNNIFNLEIKLLAIKSNFWGDDVTVAGLITGEDILDNLIPLKSGIDDLVLPSVMLQKFSKTFIDGITIADIEQKLECKVSIIENYYKSGELIDLIQNEA